MSKALISVVVPTFNRENYILESLESVFAQSYPNVEIIVVDDGSDDQSIELLKPLEKSKRLRLFRQKHAGVSAARNLAVDKARGQYIAFLDSDDLFLPEKLSKQMALFQEKPHLGFVHSNFSKFDDRGHHLGLRDMTKIRGIVYPWILQEWSALITPSTVLMPKNIFVEAGGFDESISWGEDIDLYFRVARKYEIGMVPEMLTKIRVHAASASAPKIGSAESFHRVLAKAVAADPSLSPRFVKKAFAKMYVNKSQNILGEGNSADMHLARKLALRALGYHALEPGAWLAIIASSLPMVVRKFLASMIRRIRYTGINSQEL